MTKQLADLISHGNSTPFLDWILTKQSQDQKLEKALVRIQELETEASLARVDRLCHDLKLRDS